MEGERGNEDGWERERWRKSKMNERRENGWTEAKLEGK